MESENDLKDRIDTLEKKIDVIMSMINKINENMSVNVIKKIEQEIDEAVDKKINHINKNKTIRVSMDGGANIRWLRKKI